MADVASALSSRPRSDRLEHGFLLGIRYGRQRGHQGLDRRVDGHRHVMH
jgi:hypothetical protein